MRHPPRLVVMAVGAALVLAACADAKPDDGGSGATATTGAGGEGGGGSGNTTSAKGGSAATTTARPRPTATTGAGEGSGGTSGGSATTDVRPLPTTVQGDDGSQGPPGAFARTLLRPQPAKTIVFERLEQQGAAPRRASLEHATSVVGEVSGKPVATNGPIAVPGGAKEWTTDDLRRTADTLTTAGQGNGRAVLHVLFLEGTFEGNDEVLGVAVRGDVLAIFTETVASAATPLVGRAEIEDAVLTHELGHVLGLVDLARDTGRDDPEHPGHSRNEQSVMYWAVESSLVGRVLTGPPPRDFDADDLADLRALRNGA